MAQLQWTVPSIGGRGYQVGLYHGEDSGHLVVYVNNKITLVDFGVKDSKDYSFFLEQELFELTITKLGERYQYVLAHNEELDSPYNRQRRTQQRYRRINRWVGGVIIGLVVLLAVAISWRLALREEQALEELPQGAGLVALGRIQQTEQDWYVQFIHEDQVVRAALPTLDTIHPMGFPLRTGDEFQLRYQPENPNLLRIDWQETVATQLARYRQRTGDLHQELNPNLSAAQVACQLEVAFAARGLAGWALFYHQQSDYNDNLNREAYLRFVRDPEMAEELRRCL